MVFRQSVGLLFCILLFFLSALPTCADSSVALSTGQTLYVPVYSHVYSGSNGQPFQLAAMLSLRNTDLQRSMTLTVVDYYDNDGHLVRHYLAKPIILAPLASHDVFIKEDDQQGGFGANFIVRWTADKPINLPLIESVMIGARSGQGISFVCPARPIAE